MKKIREKREEKRDRERSGEGEERRREKEERGERERRDEGGEKLTGERFALMSCLYFQMFAAGNVFHGKCRLKNCNRVGFKFVWTGSGRILPMGRLFFQVVQRLKFSTD